MRAPLVFKLLFASLAFATLAALTGCPGTLDDPGRFSDATADTGTASGDTGSGGDTGKAADAGGDTTAGDAAGD